MDKRGFEYIRADRFSLKDIPDQYIPTEKTFYFMGVFLFISIIISAFNIPFGSMMSGNTDFTIDIGFPKTMFSLSLEDPSLMPLRIGGLILDFVICLVLGLACDLTIKISSKKAKKIFSEDSKYVPKLYKER